MKTFLKYPGLLVLAVVAILHGGTKLRITPGTVTAKAVELTVKCSPDVVGAVAQVQVRLDAIGSAWKTVNTYTVGRTNEIRVISGMYISGGTDRLFRVVVPATGDELEVNQ